MDSAQNQLLEKLHATNNILVCVSRNPSVDQLSACLGLTLLINKLNKHGTAVFSGEVPSTIEFLQPEQTLEKNTDSLRDFIIALDKSKADKLRYKVEDQLVRIFITPYRTSINDKDLEFSQGDFNVDMVIALGVTNQDDLDEAITAHGRILHDATVTSINTSPEGGLGTINWHEPAASSLSELVAHLARGLGQGLLDEQIATALLTGIVAETKRFSNEKTTAQTMSVSAELMAAGANQQLVATKLEEPVPAPEVEIIKEADLSDDFDDGPDDVPSDGGDTPPAPPKPDDGTLEIEHTPEESRQAIETVENEQNDVPDEAPQAANEDSPEPLDNDVSIEPTDSSHDLETLPEESNTPAPPENVHQDQAQPEQPALEPASPLESLEPAVRENPIAADDQPPAGPAPDPSQLTPEDQTVNSDPTAPISQSQNVDRKRRNPKLVTEPPMLGGRLTANTQPEPLEPSSDPMSLPAVEPTTPLLDRPNSSDISRNVHPVVTPVSHLQDPVLPGFTPPPPAWVPPSDDALNFATPNSAPAATQSDALVDTPVLPSQAGNPSLAPPAVDNARDEVMEALKGSTTTPTPIEALNAQPLGDELHADATPANQPNPNFVDTLQQAIPSTPQSAFTPPQSLSSNPVPAPPAVIQPLPSSSLPATNSVPQAVTPPADANAAPPVPPPIPFHFGNTPQSS